MPWSWAIICAIHYLLRISPLFSNFVGSRISLMWIMIVICNSSLRALVWNRHLNTVEDPVVRTKWLKCKKDLAEEIEAVKQLDAERQAFKDSSGAFRPTSPQMSSKPFMFSPVDEYPSVSGGSDDADVWRAPQQQYGSRRPTKAGQMNIGRRAVQEGDNNKGSLWAGRKGASAVSGRGPKNVSSSSNKPGSKSTNNISSQGGKKVSGRSNTRRDSLV